MLRVKKFKNSVQGKKSNKFELYFNKELYKGVKVYEKATKSLPELLVLEINGEETTKKLKELPLHAFTAFKQIKFDNWNNTNNLSFKVEIDRLKYRGDKGTLIVFTIKPNLFSLVEILDIDEYLLIFKKIINQKFTKLSSEIEIKKKGNLKEIQCYIFHDFRDRSLKQEFNKYESVFTQIHTEISKTLPTKGIFSQDFDENKTNKIYENEPLLTSFHFPEEIRTNCNQYLLYFAKFLQDLGIDTTSNLKEEAGKILFSVTPNDETQALDKIREALAIYLKLPENPIIFDDSFAAMRLQQQIENLQHSQRMAARELQFSEKLLAAQSDMLHEKNITISQQQSVIENQQKIIEKIIDPAIMMNSVEKKEELEELYDGIKVGESESLKKWLGISLNPAKAIKTAVKNTFGKEEKNSVLGLDEES